MSDKPSADLADMPCKYVLLQNPLRVDALALLDEPERQALTSAGPRANGEPQRAGGEHLVGWMFTFAAAAYNLVRMRNLAAQAA